jgi:hypothetical protein
MMKASTTDELIAGFPHSILPKVSGEPTFEDLKIIRRILNNKTVRVSSYEWSGLHGHLGIIMTNDEYFDVATDVFTAPANPVNTATIVVGVMAAHIAENNWVHVEATYVHCV